MLFQISEGISLKTQQEKQCSKYVFLLYKIKAEIIEYNIRKMFFSSFLENLNEAIY